MAQPEAPADLDPEPEPGPQLDASRAGPAVRRPRGYTLAGFVGPKGSGKTALALHQLRRRRRVIVCDLAGQDALAAGAVVLDDPRDLLDHVAAHGARGNFRVCWRGFVDGVETGFEWACRVAWAAEDLAMLWDEADMLAPNQRLGRAAANIANMQRHRRLDLYWTSRRPAMVPRLLTSNADRLCVFRQAEPADLVYLKKRIGQAADQLPGLPDFHALDWRDGAGATVRRSFFD